MSNRLSDRFKQGDESIMQMMARIQSEITTDSIADQWQSKIRRIWRSFLVCHVAIT